MVILLGVMQLAIFDFIYLYFGYLTQCLITLQATIHSWGVFCIALMSLSKLFSSLQVWLKFCAAFFLF